MAPGNDPVGRTDFKTLFAALPGAACVIDAGLRIVAANPAWEKAFDEGRPVVVGTPISEVVHPDDIAFLEGAFRQGAAGGPADVALRIRGADGEDHARGGRAVVLEAGLACLVLHEPGIDAAAWRALIEQRQLLARAERVSRTGSWRLELSTGHVEWSDQMYELFGIDRADFDGDVDAAIDHSVHPDDRTAVRDTNAAVRSDGIPRPMDYRIVRPDGTMIWVHAEGVQECDAHGDVVALVGFARDTTEQRAAEAALRQSEEKFAAAFRVSPDSVNINRLSDGSYVDINEGFTALTGYTAPEVVGKTSVELGIWVDPADRTRLVTGLGERGEVRDLQARFRRRDGSITTALMSAKVMDIGGEPCILSITRDISEYQEAREALRASERRFRGLFHSMLEGFAVCRMVVDDEGRPVDWIYLEVNESFGRLTGLYDVAGRRVTDVIPGILESNPELFELYGEVTATGVPREFETHIEALGLDLHISVFRPEPDCFAAVFEDISDRLHAEREIRMLNADLEGRVRDRTAELESANDALEATNAELIEMNHRLDEATHAKSAFLASMSHELRTPLNSILGFSGTLLGGIAGPLEPEQRKQVAMINNSGRHLLALINDVLDLAKIESGQVEAMIVEVDCTAIARDVCEKVGPLAEAKGLQLTCEPAPAVGSIDTDETKVEQILLNLLGNAVKFTDVGHVRLSVTRLDGDVAFTVEDTGRGISREDAASIFDEFYQGSPPDRGKTTGTGLGLAVSRRLADMLGGRIEFASEPGEGARFTLLLPIVPPPSDAGTG